MSDPELHRREHLFPVQFRALRLFGLRYLYGTSMVWCGEELSIMPDHLLVNTYPSRWRGWIFQP